MGAGDGIDAMNTKFPGLPDYQGPTEGYFSLLHHEGPLVEHSHDVMERIRYIDTNKPVSEVAIRKAHIVYLDPAEVPAVLKRKPLYDDYKAKLKPLDDDYEVKRKPLYDDYKAKLKPLEDEIVAYIRPLINDWRWNGERLIF